jgi:hypothetical protein
VESDPVSVYAPWVIEVGTVQVWDWTVPAELASTKHMKVAEVPWTRLTRTESNAAQPAPLTDTVAPDVPELGVTAIVGDPAYADVAGTINASRPMVALATRATILRDWRICMNCPLQTSSTIKRVDSSNARATHR